MRSRRSSTHVTYSTRGSYWTELSPRSVPQAGRIQAVRETKNIFSAYGFTLTVVTMANLLAWPVDSLIKIFRENHPGPAGPVHIDSARNEFESGQVAVRCDQDAVVSVSCGSLEHGSGSRLQCMPRFVGYVHVRESVRNTPGDEIVHGAPGEFPDYLMEQRSVQVAADQTQPVWLTIFVPEQAPVGDYAGSIMIKAGEEHGQVRVELRVHPATVPSDRSLYLTNWISPGHIARSAGLREWSEDHWRLLRAHATSMSLHRQNVVLTPLGLIEVSRRHGKYRFDFSRFDRWIRTFQGAGVDGLIEGGHLAGRSGDWNSGFSLRGWDLSEEAGRARMAPVAVESQECEDFLSAFLPALQHHLRRRGWEGRYVQHLADEPIEANAASYRRLAELVAKYAPGLRRIDANMTTTLKGCLEIWVPVLDQFDANIQYYRELQASGNQVWFYTCLGPAGRYPNRFIDFSLLKVRLLHWINFRYGLTGYLHWGYNHWTDDPFRHTQPDWSHGAPLPAGDACIVYPGPNGPVESIRYEAMRDGAEDYELFKALSRQDEEAAFRLCDLVVRTPTDYERDAGRFRESRLRLLEAVGKIQGSSA